MNMKRIIGVVAVLALVAVALVGVGAAADTTVTGSGTQASPYLITVGDTNYNDHGIYITVSGGKVSTFRINAVESSGNVTYYKINNTFVLEKNAVIEINNNGSSQPTVVDFNKDAGVVISKNITGASNGSNARLLTTAFGNGATNVTVQNLKAVVTGSFSTDNYTMQTVCIGPDSDLNNVVKKVTLMNCALDFSGMTFKDGNNGIALYAKNAGEGSLVTIKNVTLLNGNSSVGPSQAVSLWNCDADVTIEGCAITTGSSKKAADIRSAVIHRNAGSHGNISIKNTTLSANSSGNVNFGIVDESSFSSETAIVWSLDNVTFYITDNATVAVETGVHSEEVWIEHLGDSSNRKYILFKLGTVTIGGEYFGVYFKDGNGYALNQYGGVVLKPTGAHFDKPVRTNGEAIVGAKFSGDVYKGVMIVPTVSQAVYEANKVIESGGDAAAVTIVNDVTLTESLTLGNNVSLGVGTTYNTAPKLDTNSKQLIIGGNLTNNGTIINNGLLTVAGEIGSSVVTGTNTYPVRIEYGTGGSVTDANGNTVTANVYTFVAPNGLSNDGYDTVKSFNGVLEFYAKDATAPSFKYIAKQDDSSSGTWFFLGGNQVDFDDGQTVATNGARFSVVWKEAPTITADKNSVYLGDTVTLTAVADDGAGNYTFQYSTDNGSTWTDIYNGAESSCTWTPTVAGSYVVQVIVNYGSYGNIHSDTINVKVDTITVTLNANRSNVTFDPAGPVTGLSYNVEVYSGTDGTKGDYININGTNYYAKYGGSASFACYGWITDDNQLISSDSTNPTKLTKSTTIMACYFLESGLYVTNNTVSFGTHFVETGSVTTSAKDILIFNKTENTITAQWNEGYKFNYSVSVNKESTTITDYKIVIPSGKWVHIKVSTIADMYRNAGEFLDTIELIDGSTTLDTVTISFSVITDIGGPGVVYPLNPTMIVTKKLADDTDKTNIIVGTDSKLTIDSTTATIESKDNPEYLIYRITNAEQISGMNNAITLSANSEIVAEYPFATLMSADNRMGGTYKAFINVDKVNVPMATLTGSYDSNVASTVTAAGYSTISMVSSANADTTTIDGHIKATSMSFAIPQSEVPTSDFDKVVVLHVKNGKVTGLTTNHFELGDNVVFTGVNNTDNAGFSSYVLAVANSHRTANVTAFFGEKSGNEFTFSRAVVILKAVLPGAESATITNVSGNGWYNFELEAPGFTGNGVLYFQVPLDVIAVNGYTVNDVSLIGCKTTYQTSGDNYARYTAVVDKEGTYTIDFQTTAEKIQEAVEQIQNDDCKITISGVSALKVGEKLGLDVTCSCGKNHDYTWKVNDNNLATITELGVLSALKEGTVTVTVTDDDGHSATKTITVEPKAAEKAQDAVEQKQTTTTAAKTPFPILGILAGLGIAGVLALRRH